MDTILHFNLLLIDINKKVYFIHSHADTKAVGKWAVFYNELRNVLRENKQLHVYELLLVSLFISFLSKKDIRKGKACPSLSKLGESMFEV